MTNDKSFRTYLNTATDWPRYRQANLRLLPLNLAVTVAALLYHFQPVLSHR